jgi:hypothetical protein
MGLRLVHRWGSPVAIALSLTLAAASPKGAEAATLTFSTPLYTLGEAEDYPFSYLPYFDTRLGQLDTITLELVGKAQTTAQLENLAAVEGYGLGNSVAYASAAVYTVRQGVGLWWPLADEARAQIAQTLGPFDGTQDFDGASGATVQAEKSFNAFLHIGPDFYGSDTQFFEGDGSYEVQLYAFTDGTGHVASGDYAFDARGEVSDYGLRVTYHYTPVSTPEPGLMPMLWPGLVGLGIVLLRRRKAAE